MRYIVTHNEITRHVNLHYILIVVSGVIFQLIDTVFHAWVNRISLSINNMFVRLSVCLCTPVLLSCLLSVYVPLYLYVSLYVCKPVYLFV